MRSLKKSINIIVQKVRNLSIWEVWHQINLINDPSTELHLVAEWAMTQKVVEHKSNNKPASLLLRDCSEEDPIFSLCLLF